MTLTELRYVVALAQERHFGRAAQKCFVTQPTLSLALAKLEEELGVRLFERNKSEVLITPLGAEIVEQARRVLDEAGKIASLAKASQDQLAGILRLGVIPTIGPYLLPELVPILHTLLATGKVVGLSVANLTPELLADDGQVQIVVDALARAFGTQSEAGTL